MSTGNLVSTFNSQYQEDQEDRLGVIGRMNEISRAGAIESLQNRGKKKFLKTSGCGLARHSVAVGEFPSGYPETGQKCCSFDGSYSVEQDIWSAGCGFHTYQ